METRVQLYVDDRHVVLDNGIIQVTLSNPDGNVTGISFNGVDNLLEILNHEGNRGYWDVVWNSLDRSSKTGTFEVIKATNFKVIQETEDQIEVSFYRPWDPSLAGKLVPLNIDKRYILLRGCSGFYTYAIYEHVGAADWPAFSLGETRIAFKLRKDKFQYMAIDDIRQRIMPFPDDRMPGRSQALAYQEAVLLINPMNPQLKGEVDDKYQYSCDNKDIKVHGWISTDPPVGFWQITPSYEFRSGGPLKQNLTSHVGPTSLSVFLCGHYAGDDLIPKFAQGEPWKKVFGPVFVYINSAMREDDSLALWDDAKDSFLNLQMLTEVQRWPYDFPASEDFQKADQRGSVSGTLLVSDRCISSNFIAANGAYVGVCPPGDAGSWQRECKDYQFWVTADESGHFLIRNICTGTYNLYAWVPGFIGDYRNEVTITITPGCQIEMGEIIYHPPRSEPTLWEIGVPDRTAKEFYIPDPDPKFVNKLSMDRFRQYGLWDRYSELYPDQDLVFTIGESDYNKDWFFAQVNRKRADNTLEGTTWQIKFMLSSVDSAGIYMLRVALASATLAELQVRVNNPDTRSRPLFSSGLIGRDNSIARHGIHGLHWLYNISIQGGLLMQGENVVYLTQPRNQSPFQGLMYDYIRLEAPLSL